MRLAPARPTAGTCAVPAPFSASSPPSSWGGREHGAAGKSLLILFMYPSAEGNNLGGKLRRQSRELVC